METLGSRAVAVRWWSTSGQAGLALPHDHPESPQPHPPAQQRRRRRRESLLGLNADGGGGRGLGVVYVSSIDDGSCGTSSGEPLCLRHGWLRDSASLRISGSWEREPHRSAPGRRRGRAGSLGEDALGTDPVLPAHPARRGGVARPGGHAFLTMTVGAEPDSGSFRDPDSRGFYSDRAVLRALSERGARGCCRRRQPAVRRGERRGAIRRDRRRRREVLPSGTRVLYQGLSR